MPALDNQLLFAPDAADEGVVLGIAVIEAAGGQVREVDVGSHGYLEAGYYLRQDVFVDVTDDEQFDAVFGEFFRPGSFAVDDGEAYGV